MATRAQAEVVVVRRVGRYLTAAGLDGTTVNGANADLADPIAWAVRKLDGTTADPTNPVTTEVQAVSRVDALFDLAELRALENALGNLSLVTATVGQRTEQYNDLARRLAEMIPRKRKAVEQEHGIALGDVRPARLEMV